MPFAVDDIIYLDKQPGEAIQKNLRENIVVRLSSGLKHLGNFKSAASNFAAGLSLSFVMLYFVCY